MSRANANSKAKTSWERGSNDQRGDYRYKLTFEGTGGMFVTGAIPSSVHDYWKSVSQADMVAQLMVDRKAVDERLDGSIIDRSYSKEDWTEVCDLVNVWGIALDRAATLKVVNDEMETQTYSMNDENFGACLNTGWHSTLDPKQCYLTARTFERISRIFEIETNEPFSLEKLEVRLTNWGSAQVVESFVYDDVELIFDSGDASTIDKPYMDVISKSVA